MPFARSLAGCHRLGAEKSLSFLFSSAKLPRLCASPVIFISLPQKEKRLKLSKALLLYLEPKTDPFATGGCLLLCSRLRASIMLLVVNVL
jgi:hypothetical protein